MTKRILIAIPAIILILFIIDRTLLKDQGMIQETEKYEKIADVSQLAVGLETGKMAPEILLEDMEGKQVQLSDFKGKKVLLNFWASWCGPCEQEMPHMESLYKKYKNDGFVILAVNMTKSEKVKNAPEKFAEKHKLTFPILMDRGGVVMKNYEVVAYPTTYFIDSDGIIRSKVLGAVDEEYMEKEILKLP